MRRTPLLLSTTLAGLATCAALAAGASAANPIQLAMSGGAAFAVLGHSCGGIQEKVYETGFAANGYPEGNVSLSTTCGGSGRGGGGHSTTYTGTATVVWTWFGETRSYGVLEGALEAHPAEDSHGDRLYNTGTSAFLETGTPPLEPPTAPTNITANVGLAESGESEYLQMNVGWTVAPETAGLLSGSTVTATPVGSTAPVLSATVIPYFSEAHLRPVEPNTTYRVTVTNTDAEGTSEPSAPIELTSPNSDGEAEHEHPNGSACEVDSGTIKLSPGLSETAAVQNITVKGELKECGGAFEVESGRYTAHLKTLEPVSCSVLQSASLEPVTEALSLKVKWLPAEAGSSTGSLALPLSEAGLSALGGSVTGGPFSASTPLAATAVAESFIGGPTCGQPNGHKPAKPVKQGTFSTSSVSFE
jgi:hypothetical protein